MKTTIDISNPLFKEAKRYIAQKGLSFRELVETALRQLLNAQSRRQKNFRWKHKPFHGSGLSGGLQEGDWEKVRDMIYEGHGG